MRKTRTRVPTGSADAILFESDRCCCICRKPGRTLQLHHIDGDPSNHAISNIAVLCHDHHSEATSTPGLGRRLSPGQVRKFRDQWVLSVKREREGTAQRLTQIQDVVVPHEALMDALACHEITKLRYQWSSSEDWTITEKILGSLWPFACREYGNKVKWEILSLLDLVGGRAGSGMSPKIARMIESIAFNSLPIMSMVAKAYYKVEPETERMLEASGDTGFGIAREGIRSLKNVATVAAGSRMLFVVLRYAKLNKLKKLKAYALSRFGDLENLAKAAKQTDAAKWLEFERLDALALDGEPLPNVPTEIARQVFSW